MKRTTFILYLIIFDKHLMRGKLELHNESEITLSLQPLPYFRRLLEETLDDTSPLEPGVTEYPSQDIGNVFIKNAKQILKPENDESDDFASSAEILSNFMSIRNPTLYINVLDDLVHVPSDNLNPKNISVSTTRKKNIPLSFFKQQPNTEFYQENEFNGIPEHVFAKKTVDNKKYAPVFKGNEELTLKTEDNSRILADAIYSHDNTTTTLNNFRIDFLNKTQRRVNTRDSLNGTSYLSVISSNVDKVDFENKMMDLDRKYRLFTSTMNTKVTHSVFYHTSRKNRFANIKSGSIDNSLHTHTTNNVLFTNELPLDQLPFFKNNKFFDPAIAKIYPTNCNKKPLEAILKQGSNAAKCTGIDNKPCGKQNKSFSRFTVEEHENQRKLSCIKCDNAAVDWCSAPREKLIPSTLCKHETDVCYSMHTPFGIIERGCYNALYTMSVYVCNCNLCNFLPFIEMPIMFTSKRQWIRNVYEMSRLKTLRRNMIKKITCLECTVNGSIAGDAVYNINCLEGRIEVIKAVTCKEGEVCAVKAIKKQGYIWRGCVSRPRYNYYITLCNEDLCNDEPIASIYDTSN